MVLVGRKATGQGSYDVGKLAGESAFLGRSQADQACQPADQNDTTGVRFDPGARGCEGRCGGRENYSFGA